MALRPARHCNDGPRAGDERRAHLDDDTHRGFDLVGGVSRQHHCRCAHGILPAMADDDLAGVADYVEALAIGSMHAASSLRTLLTRVETG